MKRLLLSAIVAVALITATMAASVQRADAHPILWGIAGWKVVTLVGAGILTGILVARSHAQPYYVVPQAPDPRFAQCPVHHRPSTGQPYVRANCT